MEESSQGGLPGGGSWGFRKGKAFEWWRAVDTGWWLGRLWGDLRSQGAHMMAQPPVGGNGVLGHAGCNSEAPLHHPYRYPRSRPANQQL